MDFESLYTSILQGHAIEIICDFMKDKMDNKHMDIVALFVFLTLVFSCNVFMFSKRFFNQIIGIAIGCRCGPAIANLVLHILERKWLFMHQPLIYNPEYFNGKSILR